MQVSVKCLITLLRDFVDLDKKVGKLKVKCY